MRRTLTSASRRAAALSLALAALVLPAVGAAQQAAEGPEIEGIPEVGRTLAAGGDPPYEWQRCGDVAYGPAVLRDEPSAYYRLGDSEDSTVVTDATGGETLGTFLNGVRVQADGGPFEDGDGAVAFDGADDAIEIPDGNAVDLGDSFTLEVWVRQEARAPAQLLEKGKGGYAAALESDGTIVLAKSGDGPVARSRVALPVDGGFHHVVATKDGPAARLYLDGVDVTGAVTPRIVLDTAEPVAVGAAGTAPAFRGGLDELALYRGALSAAQVRAHFDAGAASCVSIAGALSASYEVVPEDLGHGLRVLVGGDAGEPPVPSEWTAVVETRAPVSIEAPVIWGEPSVGGTLVAGEGAWAGAEPISYGYRWQTCFDRLYRETVLADAPRGYWRLGELSGATAKDASGNGNKGPYAGGAGLGADGALTAVGDSNRAVRLDGVDDHVSVPDRSSLDVGNSLTIEAWVKRRTVGSRGVIAQKGIGAFSLWLDPRDRVRFAKAGSGDLAVSTVAVPVDGAYHHVVATKNGGTIRIYLDGRNVTQAVANQTLANTSTALQIGRFLNSSTGATSSHFPGELDEVAVYGHALSAAAVARHHEMALSGCDDLTGAGAEEPSLVVGAPQVGARFRVLVTAENEDGSAVAASPVTQSPVGWGGDPVIASGTISDSQGAPVPGAAVSLHLWRSGGEALPVGRAADTEPIAETATDASGGYVLRTPVTAALQEEADANGGIVNLELRAQAEGLLYETFLVRDFGAPDGEHGLDGGEPMWVSPDEGAPATAERVELAADAPEVAAAGDAGALVDPPNQGVECSDWDTMFNIWKKTGQGEQWTRVGELHTWSTMTNRFVYGYRADSRIEVAFKTPLSKWFTNGVVHVGRSSGASTAAEVVASTDVGEYTSRAVRARFVYTHWYQCGTGNKRTRAERWNGYSLGKGGRVSSRDGECSDLKPFILQPGQVWERNSEKAVHWAYAVDLGFFSVGARSGYSRWVRSRWLVGSTLASRTLCGVKKYPDEAQRVFAGW